MNFEKSLRILFVWVLRLALSSRATCFAKAEPSSVAEDSQPIFGDPPKGFRDELPAVPHGAMTTIRYDSHALGKRREMLVS